MVIRPRNRLVIAIATAAAFFTADAALGQRSDYGQDSGHTSKVRVPDDPAREPLEVAKTALSGGDVDRALSVYQDILDKLPDRVAATDLAPRTGRHGPRAAGRPLLGTPRHVAGLIRAIPTASPATASTKGRRAAADLARAIAARDERSSAGSRSAGS